MMSLHRKEELMSKPSHKIVEMYLNVLKQKNKVWMSALNKMPEVEIKQGCKIISMEGKRNGKYFAKRIKLCPQKFH